MLLHVPSIYKYSILNISLSLNDKVISEWKGSPGKDILRVPFDINDSLRSGIVNAEITIRGISKKYVCRGELLILKYKPNEVKTDRLTGGLIVNRLPFFPFGFYTYFPVHPTLPEEEVVKGFNLMSPYQRLLPETMDQRKAYMDRCAQIGMKVNYNLVSMAGGGGVNQGNNDLNGEEKRKLLINEVCTFMNHPALLAWYIADEPDGNNIQPEKLEEIYRLIKDIDPWHPVSIVFMTPFTRAKDYAGAMDIVMADPYPIPVYPVTKAGDAARLLKKDFAGRMPVWIVPQAFGGGEHWLREPTLQEIRSMTWQAIIEGATGIQYFIRQGLNAFPKSTATWNECGRMAMEINTITPWLLSEEETIPVTSLSPDISVASKMYKGQLVVMAVNKINSPRPLVIKLSRNISTRARVLFENRTLQVAGGILNDYLPPFGSQVYKININPTSQTVKPFKNNLIADPGFEDMSSPGIPSACYVRPGSDRGATYFTDPRVTFEGSYSLRLVTPSENGGVTLRFYPVKVKTGSSYMISIRARTDPEQRFTPGLLTGDCMPQFVEVGLGDYHRARFVPENNWKHFVTFVTIPPDTLPEKKVNVFLRMPGQGVAWFDLLQMVEDPLGEKTPSRLVLRSGSVGEPPL
ncbi:MAG: hypothetical protein GYA43_05750 [Bacteroidales bacterium]|nr:hypothetical protein [Bacteroidales bacterium]